MEKNKKPSKEAKTENTPTLVISLTQLANGSLRRPFELAETFTNPIWLPFVKDNVWHLYALIEALKDNKSVSKITFIPYDWQKTELGKLEEALSHNTGVKELKFDRFTFTAAFMETLVRILKRNKTIKTITLDSSAITLNSWARFCDGLEYYNITEISIDCSGGLSVDHMKAFCEGMAVNQTIRSVKFAHEQFPGKSLEILCTMIARQPWIETLDIAQTNNINFSDLNRVLQANHLKVLGLRFCYLSETNMQTMSKALQENTSITELNLQANSLNFNELGNILRTNKTIKKLNVSRSFSLNEESLGYLDLKNNKTLTDLNIFECNSLALPKLLTELEENTTLKILRIGNNTNVRAGVIEQFFRKNETLQELYIENLYTIEDLHQCALALTNVLKVNKSLRKLAVPFADLPADAMVSLLKSLKKNTSLTDLKLASLSIRRKTDNMEPKLSEMLLDLIVDLLKKNKTLRHIEGADHLPGLKRNRETQDTIITNMCVWIKMILMKPNSFILPIEVWSNIFKHASTSFVLFNFEEYFRGNASS